MLNDIRVHIHSNEAVQEAIEARSAPHIEKTYKQNRATFASQIPNLVDELNNIKSSNISIFLNKDEQYNIVDFGLGRTLYGEQPIQEVAEQCEQMHQFSACINFEASEQAAQYKMHSEMKEADKLLSEFQQSAMQVKQDMSKSDVLVVLGLGLGIHIDWLLDNSSAKHIIIYEPERQYFKSACMVKDWSDVLAKVGQRGIGLYFQIGKDASNLVKDLAELATHFEIGQATLFQHYYHPSFDAVMHAMRTSTWAQLLADNTSFSIQNKFTEYTPPWLGCQKVEQLEAVNAEYPMFQSNLQAFKKYYPNIYAEFVDYQPQTWFVVKNENDEINLFNRNNGACWYGANPLQDGHDSYKNFEQYPNKDGLILGYNGEKLKHYLHYRLVKKTEFLLKQAEEEIGFLPDTVKSLIMFGLGAGYQLESLLANRKVEKLFICEPNRDFFYASLFAIDWSAILTKIDEEGANLYINIGDDGTHLFRDLLGQFYNIGPYVLSQTFFYQGYYNSALNAATVQLREQLQIVVSMGEYFDHACYAIEHTKEALRRGIPFLRAAPSQFLNQEQKELPILFIGNGPSLDYSLDTIRELQSQAILISCGTSLQVLQRNNIVPDFHAEIELNRATYDWACRVNDPEYLKQITLLSCNGIHPDTCDLYKSVMFAFKEGESATVSALNVIGTDKAEALSFSFPTVSNFAINLFLKLGFHQFYLFGIDMGFVDSSQHHSSQSGYYDAQGKEFYKYSEANNTGLVVPGNFRSLVNTKHEFKLAKTIIEDALAATKVDCYNTSDGAKIEGTTALPIDHILLMSSPEQKEDTINAMKTCFQYLPENQFIHDFSEKYDQKKLLGEITKLQKILKTEITDQDDVFAIIEKQKQFLFLSYKRGNSLFFYYLYGSMNYINSVLSKAAMHQQTGVSVEIANKAIELWSATLTDIKLLLGTSDQLFDTSSSFTGSRERLILAREGEHRFNLISFDSNLSMLAEEVVTSLSEYHEIHAHSITIQGARTLPLLERESHAALVLIQNGDEWRQLLAQLDKCNQEAAANNVKGRVLICIMGVYEASWFNISSQYSNLCIAFQILPQLLETSEIADYKQGLIPYSPLAIHIEWALKHLRDIHKYHIFIEKLLFSDIGLKNASSVLIDQSSQKHRQNKGVEMNTDIDESADAFVSETDSCSFNYIETNIVSKIKAPNFVDYKTYLAIPRNPLLADVSATSLDSAGSRGLRVNRQFTAVELLLRWQGQRDVEKIMNVYMKAR